MCKHNTYKNIMKHKIKKKNICYRTARYLSNMHTTITQHKKNTTQPKEKNYIQE